MAASRARLGPCAALALGGLLVGACGPFDDGADGLDSGRPVDGMKAPDGGLGDGGPMQSVQGLACVDVPAELSCGGGTCADLGRAGRDFCAVTCCTDDGRCGARVAVAGRPPGRCIEQAQPDARCPRLEGDLGRVEGCCTPDYVCGVVFGPMCVPLGDLGMRPGAQAPSPVDCDGNPLPGLGDELDGGR